MPEIDLIKAPPQDLAAEQAVLGAVFLDSERLVEIKEFLSSDDFYKNAHKIIFRTMEKLSDAREAIDVLTIRSHLESQGELEAIGGIAYIAELATATPTAANAAYYAKIVAEKSLLRQLINRLTESVEKAYEQDSPADDILAQAEKSLIDVQQGRNTNGFKKISDVLAIHMDDLEQKAQQKSNITGIATGYPALDNMTTGLHEEELIILAARPAVGKTAFALNIAHNVAFKSEDPVAIFSLEMPASQLVQRIICSMGGIEGSTMRTGEILKTNANKYYAAAERVSKCNLYIDDTPGVKINEIVAKCRKLKQEHGLKLIVIDYLQLITGSSNNRESRQQEVSDISRQLKMLARELDVPVIALSQLSRSVEQRPNKRPMMSDLRESGAIEQDADIVTFIYREGYYKASEGKEEEDNGLTEIIIAKHRNGATGEVNLAFEKNFSRFTDLAPIGPDGSSAGVRDVRG